MIRTQIYLTDIEKQKLALLSQMRGQPQSELIREAIDQFIENNLRKKKDKLAALEAAEGMWSDRNDLPDFSALRKELDRDK